MTTYQDKVETTSRRIVRFTPSNLVELEKMLAVIKQKAKSDVGEDLYNWDDIVTVRTYDEELEFSWKIENP